MYPKQPVVFNHVVSAVELKTSVFNIITANENCDLAVQQNPANFSHIC